MMTSHRPWTTRQGNGKGVEVLDRLGNSVCFCLNWGDAELIVELANAFGEDSQIRETKHEKELEVYLR